MKRHHDMPFGVMPSEAGTSFHLWAPAADSVELRLDDRPAVLMDRAPDGRFSTRLAGCLTGCRYRYAINGKSGVPDPASRFQPDGPMGLSEIIDPNAYEWNDAGWKGRPWEEAVLYEIHIGAFTREGTFQSAISKLDHLVEVGITAIEIMPVAAFPGRWGWGYDGVDLFAIESSYGRPEDLKALIDAAHARGLMVIQDVVWNHFGPQGNFLGLYAPEFFTDAHHTPWGAAINFDRPGREVVRQFYRHHALYWLEEFNVDGLRTDALHAIKDDSRPTIFEEIANAVHAAAGDRHFHLIAEDERNRARHLERNECDRPRIFTAQWNDDFHHPIHVLATGETQSYYADFAERPREQLGRALAEGFAFQGERSLVRNRSRGERSTHLPPIAFIPFVQNHDQIGNRALGDRLVHSGNRAVVRAAVAILLLSPQIPLLFMGEEWGSERPFPYFCDMGPELAENIRNARNAEFAGDARFNDPAELARLPDPSAEKTFLSAKLDWESLRMPGHAEWLDFYRLLLHIRRREILPLLSRFRGNSGSYRMQNGTVLNVDWRTVDGVALRLTANLGPEARSVAFFSSGRQIYASHLEIPAVYPPWSVRMSIG
ncbi:MAG TPA: malto-oligosyltrehalose trehalohydrolase [Alphaproteobacteria bacterium]|nr:malto-oligosyltrehalose trehalohydrolase [Alphaproteobacteria bacterium]